MKHAKKQESMTHIGKISLETVPEETPMLLNNHFKLLKMFKD